jgi:type I site-specific restriction endonuclease
MSIDKKSLSERDICTKFITPAVKRAGWDEITQIREEVSFTKGRIIVRGKLVTRGKAKRADYILYYQPNIPLALIEAKDNNHSVGDGIQQGHVPRVRRGHAFFDVYRGLDGVACPDPGNHGICLATEGREHQLLSRRSYAIS